MSLDPEVRRGGGLPFGMVCARWVCDPRYSTNARALYAILVTYSDTTSRDTGRGKPYRRELAAQMGVSMSTLDRVLAEMETAGLVTVERRQDPTNPRLNDANLYVLHDAEAWNGTWTDPLPAGVKAADVAKTTVEARRQAKREVGGGVTGEATPSVTGAARVASPVTLNIQTPVQNPSREVVDVRRTGAGSKPAGGASGYAASGKTKPRMLSQEERRAVDAVWSLLPADLVRAVPRQAHGLEGAILDALAVGQPAERTPEQLVTHRVMPRWDRHWAVELYAGRMSSPVGALRAMLARDPLCNDDRCDEHVEVDTGQPCRACARTREDRRPVMPAPMPDVATVPTPRPVARPARRPAPEPGPDVDTIPSPESIAQVRAALRGRGAGTAGRDHRPYVPK
ncbi:hypothetical protein [Streptomyces sp. NPDC056683]|uniref:hypothetical protein n=1 Tax=Streptomyces sp. NPDC056683 TaxID=3345910 RepID=UPI0036B9E715